MKQRLCEWFDGRSMNKGDLHWDDLMFNSCSFNTNFSHCNFVNENQFLLMENFLMNFSHSTFNCMFINSLKKYFYKKYFTFDIINCCLTTFTLHLWCIMKLKIFKYIKSLRRIRQQQKVYEKHVINKKKMNQFHKKIVLQLIF